MTISGNAGPFVVSFTMQSKYKKNAILSRIKSIEEDIVKAYEYLDTDTHSDWHKFRPLFVDKMVDGKIAPPHKDWVKNTFIPDREKALRKAEKQLEIFD